MSTANLNNIINSVVTEILRALPGLVDEIILYGSYARGDFSAESDIDIMVLLNCDFAETRLHRKELSRLASRLSLENDIEISISLRDRHHFHNNINILPFYRNIKSEGMTLYAG